MDLSKSVGVVLLAGIVAILAGGRIHAQNPVHNTGSSEAPLPKDIYPDSRNRLPLPNAEYQSGRLAVGIYQPGVSNWDPQLIKASRGANLKYSMDVSDPLMEIAVLVAARELDVQYEWTQWETHGRDPKDPRYLDPAVIDIIKYEKPVVGLGEKETAIINFGREIFGQRRVSSETFAQVLHLFGRKSTVDLVWVMADYSVAGAEMTAFDNHLRADQEPLLPPRPHSFDAGRRASLTASIAAAAGPLPKDIYPDSRNRLPLPKREDMDEEGKKAFDQLSRPERLLRSDAMTKRSVRLYSNPRFAAGQDEKQRYLTYDTGLSDRLLEIAVLVAAREMDSQYEWTEWETYGRDPSDPRHIEPAIIDMIKYEKPVAGLGEKEALVITFGRELLGRQKVSSETFAHAVGLLGRRGTVDLVELLAQWSATCTELAAFDQQLPAGQKPLLPPR